MLYDRDYGDPAGHLKLRQHATTANYLISIEYDDDIMRESPPSGAWEAYELRPGRLVAKPRVGLAVATVIGLLGLVHASVGLWRVRRLVGAGAVSTGAAAPFRFARRRLLAALATASVGAVALLVSLAAYWT